MFRKDIEEAKRRGDMVKLAVIHGMVRKEYIQCRKVISIFLVVLREVFLFFGFLMMIYFIDSYKKPVLQSKGSPVQFDVYVDRNYA